MGTRYAYAEGSTFGVGLRDDYAYDLPGSGSECGSECWSGRG